MGARDNVSTTLRPPLIRVVVRIIVVTLCLAMPVTGSAQAPGTPVSQIDEEQKACQATNKLEPWEERAARMVKSAPGDADAWFSLGLSLTKQKCFTDAEQAFRKSIGLWPENAAAWNGLAKLMLAQHRWNDMERALREAVRLEPDSSWGWLNLSKTLDRQRRFTDARQAYEHVTQWCSDGKLEEETVEGGMVQPKCTRDRDGEQTTVINNSLGTLTLRYTFTVGSLFKQYPECQKLFYFRTTKGDSHNPIQDTRSLADDLKLTVANGQLMSVTLPVAVDSMLITVMQGRGLRLGTANLAFVSWMQQQLQAPATEVAPLCLITSLARDAKLNAIEQLVGAFAKDVKNR